MAVLYQGHLPVAWGHLEPANGKTWLGVSVTKGYTGQGNGAKVVFALCKCADKGKWELWLTCHHQWLREWYNKFGFKQIKNSIYMRREK